MIIELIGLPGAGKSTFARGLSQLRKYQKIKVLSPGELVWFNICFLFRHPIKFLGLLLLYVRYAGSRSLWYTKFTSVFLDYNAKYMKAKRCEYALLDQGHMQLLMSLFDEVLPEKKFKRVVSFLPKSDHYIFFDIPEEVRKKRLEERGYVSRAGMSEQMRVQWQQSASVHFERLKKAMKSLAPATIDVADISSDTELLIERYQAAQFMRYITFARMPTEKAHGLQVAKMCEAFTSQGVFVSLITPKRSNDIKQAVDDFYKLNIPLQHFEAPVFDLTAHVRTMTGFHHYAHELLFAWHVLWMYIPKETIVYTRTPLVSFVRAFRGNQVITEQHFWPTHGSWLHRFLVSSATAIPCNSEGTYKACAEHGLGQAFVAHNGFDSSLLEEKITQTEARKKLDLSIENKVVMYIGSLGDWKGVDTLAEAAKSFPNNVVAVVIGGKEDGLHSWRYKYPNVLFLGPRPYEEIGSHQRAADILVVPNNPISKESSEYTSPIKLFAHMASGVPLLVSDLLSLRNIVDEKEVFFFEAGNYESLQAQVAHVLNENEEAKKRSVASWESSKQYTWHSRAQQIIAHSIKR